MSVAGPDIFGLDDLPLLSMLDEQKRAVLEGSAMGGLLPGEVIADLFCGAGGWGEGLHGSPHSVGFAVNHSPAAIATHKANNPGCSHHMGDAWKARPRDVVRGTLGVLFASAACTTHSRARGSAPISPRVHMLGWCIARWMKELSPRVVFIENVTEWQDWGPTKVVQGVRRQDPARKGQHFGRWWRYCERLGYTMEVRVLDAPDFGAACRRRRLFIIARRDGMPIVWPAATHQRGKENNVQGEDQRCVRRDRTSRAGQRDQCLPVYRSAAEVIDWTDLGTSIFGRARPLKPKTLARIAEGIRRYVLNDPRPFTLRTTHGEGRGWHVSPIDQPLSTQTTRQDLAVATPVVAVCAHGDKPNGDKRWGRPALPVDGPLNAIHAGGNNFGLATPVMVSAGGATVGPERLDGPMATVLTREGRAIATPLLATTGYGERSGQAARVHAVAELLGTCVDGVKQALVTPLVTPLVMNNTSGHAGGAVVDPLPTVTTGGQAGLVAPVLSYMRHGGGQHSDARDPMLGMTAHGTHAGLVAALLVEYYGNGKAQRADAPMGVCTTHDRHGLVCVVLDGVEFVIVDILFRMLKPAELAKAMGFRDDFVWPKTKLETVKMVGNAVSPYHARALIGSAMPGLLPPRKAVAV